MIVLLRRRDDDARGTTIGRHGAEIDVSRCRRLIDHPSAVRADHHDRHHPALVGELKRLPGGDVQSVELSALVVDELLAVGRPRGAAIDGFLDELARVTAVGVDLPEIVVGLQFSAR